MFITQLEGISGTRKCILKEVEFSSEIWPLKYPEAGGDLLADANIHFIASDIKLRALEEWQLNKKETAFAEHCFQFFRSLVQTRSET